MRVRNAVSMCEKILAKPDPFRKQLHLRKHLKRQFMLFIQAPTNSTNDATRLQVEKLSTVQGSIPLAGNVPKYRLMYWLKENTNDEKSSHSVYQLNGIPYLPGTASLSASAPIYSWCPRGISQLISFMIYEQEKGL